MQIRAMGGPLAIEPYQTYIDYLEAVVIYNLKQELAQALARPDPPSNEDEGPVTGPMVFKTNTGCEDEYCAYPCHEKKDNTPPATPSPPPPPAGFGYYMASQHSGDLCSLDNSPTSKNVII